MIEENALVVNVEEDGFAWVQTTRARTCGGCAQQQGCGTSALAGVLGRRQAAVRVINTIGAVAGDRVVIGVPESGLLRASLAVYAAPLAGLFAGALTGSFLSTGGPKEHADLWSLLFGVAGFTVALLWLRRFSRSTGQDACYQAVTLRRALPISVSRQENS